jgi:membrane protease YdiL (CAAX protease family)
MRIAKNVLICFLIAGVSIFGFVMLTDVCVRVFTELGLETPAADDTVARIRDNFLYVFFMSAILPPILEELVFRFAAVKLLRQTKLKDIWIVLITAFVFMVYHWSWSQTIYQFIMGVIFAVIYIKTNNIFYTMGIHFINNAFIIIYTYYMGSGDGGGLGLTFWNVTAAVVLALAAIAIIYDLIKELPHGKRK